MDLQATIIGEDVDEVDDADDDGNQKKMKVQ